MEQNQKPENTEKDTERSKPETGGTPPRTAAAIGLQMFLVGLALIWWAIAAYIPDRSERAKVFIDSIFSLALVILVIIQTRIYSLQAKLMDEQRKAMFDEAEAAKISAQAAKISATAAQESARISAAMFAAQGPDIHIIRGELNAPIKAGEPLKIRFNIRNTGSRTALRFSMDMNSLYKELPYFGSLPPYQDTHVPRSESTIGPNCDITVWMQADPVPTEEQIKKLYSREATVFFYGVYKYTDGETIYRQPFWRMFNSDIPNVLAHPPQWQGLITGPQERQKDKNPN